MFPLPNLGNIGELFLIQNLKTGIYYIDAFFIIMLLALIHHTDIYTYLKKSVDFIWSTNRQSLKQTFISLTKGNMHKIHYKGIQYATSYSSASIYINYPDPVIHILDYYSDIIDSRRGEKGEECIISKKKNTRNRSIIIIIIIIIINNNHISYRYVIRISIRIRIRIRIRM